MDGHSVELVSLLDRSVTRSETAKYTILSDYLPGPVILHVAGENRVRDDFKLPFRRPRPRDGNLMEQIYITVSIRN